ncbi:hypothetical protein AMTRI_Chr02g258800 [Amborella trichopoda]|uniref:Peroxidase n=1 Tax=Amborella trichopoda TaxID=13333 RepID=U5CVE0_AMBTC|nr:peroxidase 57 [Amborella trichopoda]ERN17296.1 hypothetical protein AMTR_s00037p00031210 [Amborella trichopoda]|eukprot:XP_006855829.1 peroxidase 57 [Amborella trichopoda]
MASDHVLIVLITFFLLLNLSSGALTVQFYRHSCPQTETIVRTIVTQHFTSDPSIPAGLLRLHFHDCFIRGCDASVLIDSRGGHAAEKEAPPNLTLRGFEIIDEIKSELEKQCKGIVSCADILALATRDGVALAGGNFYALPTGRRDGTISNIEDVHLPGPSFSVDAALTAFTSINMDLSDLTTLLGAHSIGFCHCGFFNERLYNFMGTGFPDSTMDFSVAQSLRSTCPQPLQQITNTSADPRIFMDQSTNSPFSLDNSFYHGVLSGRSVLQLDQELAYTDVTSTMALNFSRNKTLFLQRFSKAMIKLGNVGVLTGLQGEIRQNCRAINMGK